MPTRWLLTMACTLVLLLWSGPAPAADAPATADERPRIGVVLSGGGARGAAHIGVLKALEAMRIPIDAVAGTSMGAVVGGLYSAGLSASEIAEVLGALDWQDLLQDRAPRRDLVYRRKQDDRNILARTALGVRGDEGVTLPLGLVQGQKITQVLRSATLRVAAVQDFDELPTPFRALATDLETGQAVVMRSGDLVTVLRASMSAPGVFAPVDVGGRLLVDGGLVDNLPVGLAREMGVDVLIAVDVSFPLATRDGLESPLDVTNQMVAIMVRRGTAVSRAGLTERDVLIEPDLGRMTAVDFSRMPLVVMAGESATQRVHARLAALALPVDEYAGYLAARARPHDTAAPIAFVRAGPRSQADAERIDAVFGDLAGRPFDTAEVQRRLNRQYGLDRYESVDYRLVHEDGDRGLEVDLRRKSWGPNFMRLGVSVEHDFDGGAVGNAGARFLMTGVNTLDAEWLTDVQIGEEPKLVTEFFQPLSLTRDFFVAPQFRYEQQVRQVIEDGRRVARYRSRDTEVSFALGAELAGWGEVRVGLRRGDGSQHVSVGDPDLPEYDYDIGAAYLQFGYDRLDSAYFPKHGQAFRASWQAERESLGASLDADIVRAAWQIARSHERYSLVFSLEGGSALDDRVVSPQELFSLGGFLDLSGLPADTLTGTQYGIARTILYRRVSRGGTGLFEFPAYVGVSLEAGNVWATRDDVDLGRLETGASLFFGAESPIGPLYIAAGFGEAGAAAFYLMLGKTF